MAGDKGHNELLNKMYSGDASVNEFLIQINLNLLSLASSLVVIKWCVIFVMAVWVGSQIT